MSFSVTKIIVIIKAYEKYLKVKSRLTINNEQLNILKWASILAMINHKTRLSCFLRFLFYFHLLITTPFCTSVAFPLFLCALRWQIIWCQITWWFLGYGRPVVRLLGIWSISILRRIMLFIFNGVLLHVYVAVWSLSHCSMN